MANALAISLQGINLPSTSVSKSGIWERLLGLAGTNAYPAALGQSTRVAITPILVSENARRRELEINDILKELETHLMMLPTSANIVVERDIWAPMPPKSEFTLDAKIEFEGRATPSLFVDWVEED